MSDHRDPAMRDALTAVRSAPASAKTAAFLDLDAILSDPPLNSGPPPAGASMEELIEEGAKRFRKGGAAALHYEAWDLAAAHRGQGHTLVLVAGTTRDSALPVAGELDVEHLICNELEIVDGRVTGRLESDISSGAAKRDAVRDFADQHGIDLSSSFAYAGQGEDVELLDAVGHAVVIDPDDKLRELASGRGWRTIAAFDRVAGAAGVAQTVASYGAFMASTGIGIAAGLAKRGRRPGVDAMSRTFAKIGPPLSGIHVNVQGEHHAHENRPAVFLINHQSHLVDAIVTFRILRDNFTVVAKKEVRNIPAIGQATWLADWAYVSRVGDKSEAVAAIQDAVDKLNQGISVILAPEGTRSVGPRPGRFKKGGFFMAREARVPVVPIVMRNCGELMWRNGKALKGGTVDVVVHPPIYCNDWTDEEFTERVDAVRELFVRTLEDWPQQS